METVTEVQEPVKPKRKRPERKLRLLVPAEVDQPALLRLTVGKKADVYRVFPIACDIGGRGFTVEKLDGLMEVETVYHVRIDSETRVCDCKGHLQHHHCKHADGIAKLVELKLI
jgi:hypothetical protein